MAFTQKMNRACSWNIRGGSMFAMSEVEAITSGKTAPRSFDSPSQSAIVFVGDIFEVERYFGVLETITTAQIDQAIARYVIE